MNLVPDQPGDAWLRPPVAAGLRVTASVIAVTVLGGALASSAAGQQPFRRDTANREEPSARAGGAFVLNVGLAGALLYGPALGSITRGRWQVTTGLTAGAAMLIAGHVQRSSGVSLAQSGMALNGAWRGALIGHGLSYAARDESPICYLCSVGGSRQAGLATLAGALAGTAIGYNVARDWTDADATGASLGANVAGATAFLLMLRRDWVNPHHTGDMTTLATASLLGYPAGLAYVRLVPYRVTAGDASVVGTAGLLGTMAAASLLPSDSPPRTTTASRLTVGLLAGLLAGDRFVARPFDLTSNEAAGIRLITGTVALVAAAAVVNADRSWREAMALGTGAGGLALWMVVRDAVR